MSARDIAYGCMVLLWRPNRQEEMLASLSDERRAEVEVRLQELQGASPNEVTASLLALRERERLRQQVDAEQRFGIREDRMLPQLYAWLTRSFRR